MLNRFADEGIVELQRGEIIVKIKTHLKRSPTEIMKYLMGRTKHALLITFEGFISFISPCMLPMMPMYVSYFSGVADSTGKGYHLWHKHRK